MSGRDLELRRKNGPNDTIEERGDGPVGRVVQSQSTLAMENEALKTMFFVCSGHARVMIGGREVSRLEKGSFVGEVAFLTDKPATATVIAEDGMRALAFDGNVLRQFFHKETEVAGLIYQLLGRELANKIKVSNTLLATAGA